MPLRARLDSDLEPLVEVAARIRVEDGYPAYLPDNDFHRFLTRPSALASWVVEVDDGVVAHVALNAESQHSAMEVVRDSGITGELGVIARLLVDPRMRRRGLGTLLLEHARAEAVKLDRIPVLDVVATAHDAISLYGARGWEEIGRCTFGLPEGPSVEEIVFTCSPP